MVLAVLSLAVLTGIGTPPADAQSDPVPWGGTVEVRGGPLSVKAGESVTYFLRLSEPPTADGWWVRVHVDGVVWGHVGYKGLSWVPSVGWGFDQDDWYVWRGITIRADESAVLSTQVTFTHEVWDHTTECPVHNASPVTVRVDTVSSPDGGNPGDRNGPGDGNGPGDRNGPGDGDGPGDGNGPGDGDGPGDGNGPGDGDGPGDGGGDPPTSGVTTLAIHDVTVTEDSGSAVFRVSLSRENNEVVTVDYSTFDGTATAGSDYTATSATLTFEPGETRKTIPVEVLDDDEVEGDEILTVRLSDARNATLGAAEATGTIRDDDTDEQRPSGRPELVIHDVAVAENAGSAVFRVGLSAESDQAVTVAYRTSDWTATAGADYTATNGTLVFQPGETRKAIAVPVLDDSEEEGDETFTMRLSDVRNATLVDPEGTGTIRDDDADDGADGPSSPSGLPALVIDDVTVAEDGGSAPFTVSLSRQSGAAVTVAYETSDWTATAGSDYTATSGSLTFAPGETRKTIAVPVLADDEEEGDEIFTVRLSDARNAALADHEGTGTIRDDEDGALEPMDRVTTDWIGHFGRTAAAQVVDALDERMRCARDRRSVEGTPDHPSPRWRCTRSTVGVVPAGNPFDVSSTEQQDAPGWSLWGRGSFSRFDVEGEDARVLGGGVGTATFGADLAAGQVLLGIALSHSQGGGSVSIDDVAAQVTSILTGFHPYLRLGVNDRLSLWGTVGIGTGTLTRTMNDDRTLETGIALRMAAVGGLAQILSPTENNPLSVSIKADGLLLAIDANASASFAAASVDASRLRLVLEGAYDFVLGDGHWIAPFVDVGGRLDGGGVETGWGMEIGGGVRYAHPEQHLTAELHACPAGAWSRRFQEVEPVRVVAV